MILGFKEQFVPLIKNGQKIHTIRQDKHHRWKAGRTIHMATGVRTKAYSQFGEIECTCVQTIVFRYPKDRLNGATTQYPIVVIDGYVLRDEEIDALAKNDGFLCTSGFLEWFNKDFTGKIIHWTQFRY